MNKKRWGLLVIGAVLLLAGCGVFGGRKLVPYNVKNVKVTYENENNKVSWYLKTSKINQWKKWAQSLSYEPITFEKGKSPNDTKKGERYTFQVNDGETSFSYMDPDNCYLLKDKKWYFISNPTEPPVLKKKEKGEAAPAAGPGELSVFGKEGTIKINLQKGWDCSVFLDAGREYVKDGIYGLILCLEKKNKGYISLAYQDTAQQTWRDAEYIKTKEINLAGEKAKISKSKYDEDYSNWGDIIFTEKKKNIVIENNNGNSKWNDTDEKQIFEMLDTLKYEK